jgi:hypothetical protein
VIPPGSLTEIVPAFFNTPVRRACIILLDLIILIIFGEQGNSSLYSILCRRIAN